MCLKVGDFRDSTVTVSMSEVLCSLQLSYIFQVPSPLQSEGQQRELQERKDMILYFGVIGFFFFWLQVGLNIILSPGVLCSFHCF